MAQSRRTRPQDLAARARAVKAVQLRTAGATYKQIANALGYASPSGAYKAVQRVLQECDYEAADELRRVGLLRLERMLSRLWPIATDSDSRLQLQALDRCLGIIAEMNKLAGLTH